MATTLPDQYRGDTWRYTLSVTENGAAKNITGCSAKLTLKRSTEQADADAAVSVAATIVSAVLGTMAITVPAATTAQLQGKYAWDIQFIDASGNVSTVAGTVVVKADVTRATS